MRGDNDKNNLNVINIAKKYLGKGVVGIDLAGAEALYPTKDYISLFKYAKSLEIPFTIHAGEDAGAESIKVALEMGAKRIGHGVKVIEDKSLQQKLIDDDILLDICVTSNYQTEAIKGKHPIEMFYKNGIKINISTDNDTVSNININEEYNNILNNASMNENDLIKCNKNTINFIFAKDAIKEKLWQIY